MSEGCVRCNQRMSAENLVQFLLEFVVERTRNVGTRGGKLCAEAFDRLDSSGLETRVQLQSEIAARRKIDSRPAVDPDPAAIDGFVLCLKEDDAALDGLGDRIVYHLMDLCRGTHIALLTGMQFMRNSPELHELSAGKVASLMRSEA